MLQNGSPLLHPDHHPLSTSSTTHCEVAEGSMIEAEVISVIRTIDINLSWLHPTKLYACSGIKCGAVVDEACYSRYFQTLNLWLAANKRMLVSIML